MKCDRSPNARGVPLRMTGLRANPPSSKIFLFLPIIPATQTHPQCTTSTLHSASHLISEVIHCIISTTLFLICIMDVPLYVINLQLDYKLFEDKSLSIIKIGRKRHSDRHGISFWRQG